MTPDALSNPDNLLIIIQGAGAVRAGQWARALCINDSLRTGSILPYLEEAITKRGYGVVVLNPNQNYVEVPSNKTHGRGGKSKKLAAKKAYIRGSESPEEHALYCWDHIIKKAKARNIAIVAHSYGGISTSYLLQNRGKNTTAAVAADAAEEGDDSCWRYLRLVP
eukprot:GEZU01010773.1.p2 GENE.GEZU01010773.1~~GEZU01010773.1.p2  ORF type:complete len:165 (-),score=41.14 GEZU01010773.1:52-546(-)